MHPNKNLAWHDRAAILRFVSRRAFAHVFAATAASLKVAHAPVIVTEAGRVRFHLAKNNRLAVGLDGRSALLSVTDRDGYHSANWYASENQVPTWLYEAAEIEGIVRRLCETELVSLVDSLSEQMERRFSPASPWTRAKMAPGKFEAMLSAIVGFELEPLEIRGTRKFNQHKSREDVAATIEGQSSAGRQDVVDAIHELSSRG